MYLKRIIWNETLIKYKLGHDFNDNVVKYCIRLATKEAFVLSFNEGEFTIKIGSKHFHILNTIVPHSSTIMYGCVARTTNENLL